MHKLLLSKRQVASLHRVFANHSSDVVKLLKTEISKTIQSGGFLGALFSKLTGPLMKFAMLLFKNILLPFGLADGSDSKINSSS